MPQFEQRQRYKHVTKKAEQSAMSRVLKQPSFGDDTDRNRQMGRVQGRTTVGGKARTVMYSYRYVSTRHMAVTWPLHDGYTSEQRWHNGTV